MPQSHSSDKAATGTLEKSPDNTAWIIRSFRDDDVPGLVSLINSQYESYNIPFRTGETEMRTRLAGPRVDPQRQDIVVDAPRVPGVPEGVPVGYGAVRYEDDPEANDRMFELRVVVHKAAEQMDLEQTIARRLVEIVRGYQTDPAMPLMAKATVKAWASERLQPLRALWTEMGLREVRQFWTMARPLNEPIDEPSIVEGVTVRNYRYPQDNQGALQAFDASFIDHWDYHPLSPEDWEHWLKSPGMRADLSLLAEIDAEPGTFAGFCMIEVNETDNKLRGVCEGWIELLGTVRGWRRVGLGRSLLLHGLHSLKSAGMDTALLGVDSESPTGANKLYESVGFRIRNRGFNYACDLEGVKI